MKKIILSLFFILAFTIVLNAQFAIIQPPIEEKKIEFYKNKLKILSQINIENVEIYNNIVFNQNNQKLKVSELSEFDKKIFFLTVSEKFYSKLQIIEEDWQKDLGKSPINKKEDIATKEDVKQFLLELKVIINLILNKREETARFIFNNYPDKFTDIEKTLYLNNLKKN